MIGELFDDIRFRESFLDVAALIRPGGVRKILRRNRVPDEVSLAMAQIGRIRCHAVLESRREWQDFVLYFDRVDGVRPTLKSVQNAMTEGPEKRGAGYLKEFLIVEY